MTDIKTLKEAVDKRIQKNKGGKRRELVCSECGRKVREVSVYGDRWLCVDCERKNV